MQIQVNTDNRIAGTDELVSQVQGVVEASLSRFGEQVTRVEVHLSDQNSPKKSGPKDKRCVMEARLSGLQPITVTDESSSLELAVEGAADKLEKAVGRTIGKLSDSKGGTSASGQATP